MNRLHVGPRYEASRLPKCSFLRLHASGIFSPSARQSDQLTGNRMEPSTAWRLDEVNMAILPRRQLLDPIVATVYSSLCI